VGGKLDPRRARAKAQASLDRQAAKTGVKPFTLGDPDPKLDVNQRPKLSALCRILDCRLP
jgi:hypothetical protein